MGAIVCVSHGLDDDESTAWAPVLVEREFCRGELIVAVRDVGTGSRNLFRRVTTVASEMSMVKATS